VEWSEGAILLGAIYAAEAALTTCAAGASVLDPYEERKPKDPTIREKFDTYRIADHKEKVIELLARVTTVSVETVRIVAAMKVAGR
jgi:predicted helicase